MGRDDDQKHRCKYCQKGFACGRSLGGHMRCHLSPAAAAAAAGDGEVDEKVQASRGTGYGLRENPKKTWRHSDSTTAVMEASSGDHKEKKCRECGREFESWRALFGHMRCHSDKLARRAADGGGGEEEEQEEDEGLWSVGGSHVNEVTVPKKKRRPRRPGPGSLSGSASASAPASSSSSPDLYSTEQEYVAISLMMLSRDVGYWGNGFGSGFSQFGESSDKNSAVVSKKLELDGGGREFEENYDDSLKKKKKIGSGEIETRLGSNAERITSRYECTNCNKCFTTYQALGGHRASHKRMRGCFVPNSSEAVAAVASINEVERNVVTELSKASYQCHICGKVFSSGQALGGHKRCHLVMAAPAALIRQVEQEEDAAAAMSLDSIDLNLPAPVEGDSSNGSVTVAAGADEYRSWWARSNLRHEGLISMIAN